MHNNIKLFLNIYSCVYLIYKETLNVDECVLVYCNFSDLLVWYIKKLFTKNKYLKHDKKLNL